MDKVQEWINGRARYAQEKTIIATPGLKTNEHAPEISPGFYLDDAKEFCVSATCKCKYRYQCEDDCTDPACMTFCT